MMTPTSTPPSSPNCTRRSSSFYSTTSATSTNVADSPSTRKAIGSSNSSSHGNNLIAAAAAACNHLHSHGNINNDSNSSTLSLSSLSPSSSSSSSRRPSSFTTHLVWPFTMWFLLLGIISTCHMMIVSMSSSFQPGPLYYTTVVTSFDGASTTTNTPPTLSFLGRYNDHGEWISSLSPLSSWYSPRQSSAEIPSSSSPLSMSGTSSDSQGMRYLRSSSSSSNVQLSSSSSSSALSTIPSSTSPISTSTSPSSNDIIQTSNFAGVYYGGEDEEEDDDDGVKVWTQITFSAEYDQELIQHTIQHYLDNANVDPSTMLITLHHYDPDAVDELESAITKVTDLGVPRSLIQTWHGNFTSQKNCDRRIEHRKAAGVSSCDWILKFDADELLRVPNKDISTFLEGIGSQGFDVAFGDWVDRVAPNGTIPNMTTTTPIDEQFPMGCQFSGMGDAVTFKAFAFRGYLKEKRAGHRIHRKLRNSTCPYTPRLLIDHYKWSWDVFDKLTRRIEHYRSLPGVHWWTESVAFLDHIAANDGKIDVSRPDLQCEQLYGQPKHEIPYIDSKVLGQPMLNEHGNVDPNNCGRPLKQCPSKISRRHLKKKKQKHQQQQPQQQLHSYKQQQQEEEEQYPNPRPATSFVDQVLTVNSFFVPMFALVYVLPMRKNRALTTRMNP